MTLQSTITRLAAITEAHGEALLARGDEAGACEMFAVQERADDLLKALTASEETAALVEDLMHLTLYRCEVLAALSQALDGAPHGRRNAQRVIERAVPEFPVHVAP